MFIVEKLKERLDRRMKKRRQSGDFRVCAAHDVSPILEKVLGIKERDLMKDEKLLELIEKYGPDVKEGIEQNGLVKKRFAPIGEKGRQEEQRKEMRRVGRSERV